MPDAYSPRFDDALVFTAQQFRRKWRKGRPIPYLTHLLSVAAMVGEGGGDEDAQIAALLHDWIEDIPGATAEELETRYGAEVRRLVVELSDCWGAPKPPWEDRKRQYLEHLREADPTVKLISVADKLHNCRSTMVDIKAQGVEVLDGFNAPRERVLWYYRSLVEALQSQGWQHYLLDELREAVSELHALAGVEPA